MKRTLGFTLLFFSTVYASEPSYFPAQIKSSDAPSIQMLSDFDKKRMDITLTTRQRILGYDENDRVVPIPQGTNLLLETTLNQIYNSYKQASPFESMFSTNGGVETMTVESPDALRMKAVISELIQIKIQEQMMDRLGSSGRLRDELVEVRVKKEGKIQKLRVDLEKAAKEETIEVRDSEDAPYRLPTDYDGTEAWKVEKGTEAGDIIKCTVCGPSRKSDLSAQLENKTVTQRIVSKFSKYSNDSKTARLVKTAMDNKLSPAEYKKRYIDTGRSPRCYAAVKDALLAANLVASRLDGVSPRYAGEQLQSQGFINLLDDPELGSKIRSPSQAPKGAVLVYEPVPSDRWVRDKDRVTNRMIMVPDYGHIEIKTADAGEPGYVSDYFSKNARTGDSLQSRDRKLIGIYVKANTD